VSRAVAEQIAEVVADIRAGRVNHPAAFDRAGMAASAQRLALAQLPQPVVDCTAIFNSQRVAEEINPYEDYPSITPPWDDAFLCYVNTFGNVICMQVSRVEIDGTPPKPGTWVSQNDTDWSTVRWVAETAIWIGGTSGDGQPMPTSGPCHLFRHAIHADGSPADINWLALMARRGQFGTTGEIEDPNEKTWEAAMVTLGASLNFLNASNVDIAEPARDRPTRRRIERTGVTVQTIVVRPPGKRRDASTVARPLGSDETVVSPVRGHFSHYGEQFGRGLLFGKLSGKFWIPGHVRGAADDETAVEPKSYVLTPGRSS
jgi:hypothetical protein